MPIAINENILGLTQKKVLEQETKVVDVMIWSGSRPDLLRTTIETFLNHVKFDGILRFFLEEGDFNHTKSLECVEIAKEFKFEGIHVENVNSQGYAMTNAMDRWGRSPYMFSLEDDWECTQDIPLTEVVELMNKHQTINQVRFNKRATMGQKGTGENPFIKVEREFGLNGKKYVLTSADHWYFNPSIWRMSYVMPIWEGHKDNAHIWINHNEGPMLRTYDFSGFPGKRPDGNWCADKWGVFIWGGIAQYPAFFNHIGVNERSVRRK